MSSINEWKNKRAGCIIFVAILAVSLVTTQAFVGCGGGGGGSSDQEPVPEEQQPNLLNGLLALAAVAAIVAILWPQDECVDLDGDGYGSPADPSCLFPDLDCDDSDPTVNPGAAEVADDGIDQDCNGVDTITCIVDDDMDGYGTDVGTTVLAPDGSCDTADGESLDFTDCDDTDPDVNPGAVESFSTGNCSDGVDNDCDGSVDLDEACFMAEIPAGEFVMGSDSTDAYSSDIEYPEHVVLLSAYEIDYYEVTNSEFADFLNAYGSNTSPEGYEMLDVDDPDRHVFFDDIVGFSWYAEAGYEDHPVIQVTWYGANTFCDYNGKRLPTEAEREKAARGGCELGGAPGECEDPADERTYPWGEEAIDCDQANYQGCVGETAPVGSYPLGVSPYGAYDMAGNVEEWIHDWFDSDYYDDSPYQDPQGPGSGMKRVLRGCCWGGHAYHQRVAGRSYYEPDRSASSVGFRCAR